MSAWHACALPGSPQLLQHLCFTVSLLHFAAGLRWPCTVNELSPDWNTYSTIHACQTDTFRALMIHCNQISTRLSWMELQHGPPHRINSSKPLFCAPSVNQLCLKKSSRKRLLMWNKSTSFKHLPKKKCSYLLIQNKNCQQNKKKARNKIKRTELKYQKLPKLKTVLLFWTGGSLLKQARACSHTVATHSTAGLTVLSRFAAHSDEFTSHSRACQHFLAMHSLCLPSPLHFWQ